MMQFAGIDLIGAMDLSENQWRTLDRWWIREQAPLLSFPGYTAPGINILPIPDRPRQQTPIPLSTLVWPTGASRFAQFVTFVGGDQKTAIEAAVGLNSPTPQLLVTSDETNGTSITASMYLLGLRPVFVQSLGMQLWMLYLVDERYYWWMTDNEYAFVSGTDTWTDLLNNLVAAVSTTVPTIPSISTAYGIPANGIPSARWSRSGIPIPPIIDAAAVTVGLRLVRGLNGSITFVNPGTALANSNSQYAVNAANLAFGGQSTVQELIGTIPASVNVSFSGTASDVTLASLSLAAFGTITGVADYSGFIWADPDDSTTVPGYANQAATDYYGWLLSLVDAVFRSIRTWNPTGLEDRIEWEYLPRLFMPIEDTLIDTDVKIVRSWKRITTRVVRADWGDNNQYGGPATSMSCLTNLFLSGGGQPIAFDSPEDVIPVPWSIGGGSSIDAVPFPSSGMWLVEAALTLAGSGTGPLPCPLPCPLPVFPAQTVGAVMVFTGYAASEDPNYGPGNVQNDLVCALCLQAPGNGSVQPNFQVINSVKFCQTVVACKGDTVAINLQSSFNADWSALWIVQDETNAIIGGAGLCTWIQLTRINDSCNLPNNCSSTLPLASKRPPIALKSPSVSFTKVRTPLGKKIDLPVLKEKCKWQGELRQECKSCGDKADYYNIYNCDHPLGIVDICTRGVVSGKIQDCLNCVLHEVQQ